MVKMRTLGKTSWEKIKVGEVFAHSSYDGGFNIAVRTKEGYLVLASNLDWIEGGDDHKDLWEGWFLSSIYKLPLAVQRLWITE